MNSSVLDGYMKDSQGRLVPEATVSDVDKLRDEMVQDLVRSAQGVSQNIREFKEKAFDTLDCFVDLSAEEYGVKWGGAKGNISLLSYDGKYKVTRAIAEHFVFDERLQVAKKLIDECLNDWAKQAGPELKTLVNDAFQVDKQGNVNSKRIISLRKHNISDPRWKKAMQAISDSLTVAGSKTYVRLYERVEESDNFRQIPMDLASV